MLQRLQPPHEATDESDDSHSHLENPFGAPPRESPCVERMERIGAITHRGTGCSLFR